MKTDSELLRHYADHGDEAAFAEVVRRHVNLVYASAVRLLNGDAALAQDVTQTVFTSLARKADALFSQPTAAGWLYNSVRFEAAKAIRAEQRRRTRELEASTMTDQTTTADNFWTQLRPLLDEAVAQLGEEERDAVLLRFFEEKSHREVGEALGLNENAARMRVERAVEKLRSQFARYGVTTTAALLTTTLGARAASIPAPAAFAAALAGKSLTEAAATGAAVAPTTRLASSFMAKFLVVVMAAFMLYLFFRNPDSSARKPALIAAPPPKAIAQPALASYVPNNFDARSSPAVNDDPVSDAPQEPGTPFVISPTQYIAGPTALRLYAGTSENITAAKNVLADIARMFHAGDMAAFTEKYIVPEDRDRIRTLLERMQAEPPEQQFRWQAVLDAFDALQDQTPGFTISGVATFDDHIIYADTAQEKSVPDNWVGLKFQDGQWYLSSDSATDLYLGTHLKRSWETSP